MALFFARENRIYEDLSRFVSAHVVMPPCPEVVTPLSSSGG